MPKFKKLTIYEKFKIYLMLKRFSARKISKVLKINRNTINKIRKEGFFKFDKLAYCLYLIKERHPHLTLKEIQQFCFEKFKKVVSIETIRIKLAKYGIYKEYKDEKLEQFISYLIENNYYKEASKILKFYKPKNISILRKLPFKYIPIYLRADLMECQFKNYEFGDYERFFDKVENQMKICLRKNFILSYYKFFALKISLLLYLNRQIDAYILYLNHINYIFKLPKSIKISILKKFLFLVYTNPKISNQLLNYLRRFINDNSVKEAIIKTYRNLGNIKKAKLLSNNHFYDCFFECDFKKFFKFSNYHFNNRENELLYKILKLIAIVLSKKQFEDTFQLKLDIEKIYNEKKEKIYESLYYFALGVYHLNFGEVREAEKFLEKSIKTGIIILKRNKWELSKFRKQELILKYLLNGNIKTAVEIARRSGNLGVLNIYAFLLKKSFHKIKKYKELRYVSSLIRKNNKIKAYFMRFYPVIYVNNRKFIIYRFSKSYKLLAYLILNNSRAKINQIDWIKDIKSSIYFINHKFKTTLLSIHNDEIFINGEVDCDIDRFLKLCKSSKKKALMLYRAEPFRTICYYHNWAEDIRDLVKMKREEMLGYKWDFSYTL
jgi:hypothetical protein